MLRLTAFALALLGLAAAGLLVPLHGRTVADRWRAASGPGEFASSTWHELTAEPPPADEYTPAERKELERLLSERSR
jgi:hypothetical protein